MTQETRDRKVCQDLQGRKESKGTQETQDRKACQDLQARQEKKETLEIQGLQVKMG